MNIKIEKNEIDEEIMKKGNEKYVTVTVKNGMSFEAKVQYLKLKSDDAPTQFAIVYFKIIPTNPNVLQEFNINNIYRISLVGTYFNAKVKKKHTSSMLVEVIGYNNRKYDYHKKKEEEIEFETI